MPDLVQLAIQRADAAVDPGARAPGCRFRAAIDHRLEVAIDENLELVGADRTRKPFGQMEPVQRYQAPHIGLEPVQRGVVGILRHRENTTGIGLEQHLGGDLDETRLACGIAAGHAINLTPRYPSAR